MEQPSPEFIPSMHEDSYANVTIRIPRRVLADVYAGKRVEGVLVPGRSSATADWTAEEAKQSGSQTDRAQQDSDISAGIQKGATSGTPANVAPSDKPTPDKGDKENNPDEAFVTGATIISGIFAGISLLGMVAMGIHYNLSDDTPGEKSADPYVFIFAGVLISIILLFVASLTSAESGKTYISWNSKETFKMNIEQIISIKSIRLCASVYASEQPCCMSLS